MSSQSSDVHEAVSKLHPILTCILQAPSPTVPSSHLPTVCTHQAEIHHILPHGNSIISYHITFTAHQESNIQKPLTTAFPLSSPSVFRWHSPSPSTKLSNVTCRLSLLTFCPVRLNLQPSTTSTSITCPVRRPRCVCRPSMLLATL